MPDSITISHAQEVVSHLSQLTENQYSSIVAAKDDKEKEKLKKTAIGPRMADLEPDQVTLVGADDKKITQQELIDTFNKQLTKDGGAELTEGQKKYLWEKSIVVIKDPGESANPANSPATVPDASPAAPPTTTATTTRPEPVAPTPPAVPTPPEDTAAPTLSSSSPSNAAKNIARNSNIDLTFSENIRLADAAKIKLFKKSDNTEVSINTSVEGDKTLRIKPKADLEASTEYYVKIDPGAVTDASKNKNAYAGITTNTDLSFTTGTTALTPEQQAAADKVAAGKNNPVLTPPPASEVAGSNSFNKPVTKLNLDADDTKQSAGEKKLEKLVNLRYGLDLLESKDDVHVALGGVEESYINGALESLKKSPAPDSEIDNGSSDEYKDGKTPTSPEGFVLKQAIEEYKKTDKTLAEKAEKARDKKINAMAEDEKKALIAVFENYQKKFTKLKGEVSEEKLKKYLTDNYDTLKDLEIDEYPKTADKAADIKTINGKKKEELITLSVAARNKLNERISEEFKTITISPEDKKAFLKKYTDIDFSDSGKSIEFIKSLSDEELLILNRYSSGTSNFISRDFIIRELSQHKLSLKDTLGLYPYRLSEDSDLVSFTDRGNLLKKYDPKNTDLSKNKEFIQGLTPAELVLLRSSLGFVSKESLLRELDKPENKGKSLGDIFNAEVVSSYLDSEQGLNSKSLKEINQIVNNPQIKAALTRNTEPLEIKDNFKYSKDGAAGKLYKFDDSYLVDFGEGKAKFYRDQDEILGLPKDLGSNQNYFLKLAQENKGTSLDLGFDISSDRIYPTSLLRVGENARRIREKGTYGNVLHRILEQIYTSEAGAPADQKAWHKQMKQYVARMLLAKDPAEFDSRRAEFQDYLNETDKGISGGWFNVDGLRRTFNNADGQTEQMLREVKELLSNAALGS
ncbi:MAG: Ig-like domain-containing protein [Candidatus Melainabacteria bacterium]|nr:Ig-like domain-containing protein [Candidatus Melainabacteria bacterium]